MSTRSIVTTALVLTALGIVASPVYAQGTAPAASNSATIIQWSILTAGFALGDRRRARRARPGQGRGGGRRGHRAQPQRDDRHPWKPAARSRAHRVAGHLRAAHLADPAVPLPVREVARRTRSALFASSFRHRAAFTGRRGVFFSTWGRASALRYHRHAIPRLTARRLVAPHGVLLGQQLQRRESGPSRAAGADLQRDPPDDRVGALSRGHRVA